MRRKRAARQLTVRDAAKEAGVSASTFSRVSQGDYVADVECLLLLAHWVGAKQVRLSSERAQTALQPARATIVHNPDETTLESIANHLHADQDITPEDADALMDSLRSQYQHLRRIRQVAAQ